MSAPFPVGGPRQPVYDFLLSHGWLMQRQQSDKLYLRADGLELHLYGAGSQAIVYDANRNRIADGPLRQVVEGLDAKERT